MQIRCLGQTLLYSFVISKNQKQKSQVADFSPILVSTAVEAKPQSGVKLSISVMW